MERWVQVDAAAAHCQRSKRTVWQWAKDGKLQWRDGASGREYLIECEDAAEERDEAQDLHTALHSQIEDLKVERDGYRDESRRLSQQMAEERRRSDTLLQGLQMELSELRQLALPPPAENGRSWWSRLLGVRV